MLLDLGVGHRPPEGPREEAGQEPPRILLRIERHDAEILSWLLRVGRLERQVAVEQAVAARRPLLRE
ncbi:MAG: hypothetical protein ACKOBP_03565, partial [Planctomycetia bacterium]